MKKLLMFLLSFLFLGVIVFCQQPKAIPTQNDMKVEYPSKGDTVIADSMCLIRWTRPGIKTTSVKIILAKSGIGKVLVIANSAKNNGKYFWTVPYDLAEWNYLIGIKAGNLVTKGGLFTVKHPSFTLYEPHANEELKIGSVKNIKWHAENAEGVNVRIGVVISSGRSSGSYTLVKDIPAIQKEWVWVVGKHSNNTANTWAVNSPGSTFTCHISISKSTTGHFQDEGPKFKMVK
jgi:hypothetical protein